MAGFYGLVHRLPGNLEMSLAQGSNPEIGKLPVVGVTMAGRVVNGKFIGP